MGVITFVLPSVITGKLALSSTCPSLIHGPLANVSLNRIADFLRNVSLPIYSHKPPLTLPQTELLDAFTTPTSPAPTSASPDDHLALGTGTYSWSSAPAAFRLHITTPLAFPPHALSLVVGPTGAGKTAVLLALLGELRADAPGAPLPRAGGIAYAAQEAWVLGGTIRVRGRSPVLPQAWG